jgi:hypothetical protein
MNNIIDKIETILKEAKSYAEAKYQSVRLESIQKSVETTSAMVTWFIIAIVGFMVLLLGTLLLGLVLSEWLGSHLYGFGVITLFYTIVFAILVYKRDQLITTKIKNILYGFFIK